jgi:hypothetical protein
MRLRLLLQPRCFAIAAAAFCSATLCAETPKQPSATQEQTETDSKARDYVRYVGDNVRGKLETAVITMKNAAGVQVDLIGAVHIADASYYKLLTDLFTGYESLLFELVDGQKLKEGLEGAPRQLKMPKHLKAVRGAENGADLEEQSGSANASFDVLRILMQSLGNYLRLQYQTDGINYLARNFVHADVSLEEFQRLQDEKGESFATLFRKAFEAQLSRGTQKGEEPTGGQLLLALLGDSSGIKIAMARMLGQAEELGAQLGFGPDSVIVGERNRVALEVFDQQLKAGRKLLGIFYGAAHLTDLETRLEQRGFRRTAQRWLTAWDIKPRVEEKKENGKPSSQPKSQ